MIIRKYGNIPATIVPDVGEQVMARRSRVDKMVPAVITHVSRRRDGGLRFKVVWLGSLEETQSGIPVVEGKENFIYAPASDWRLLIRQADKHQSPGSLTPSADSPPVS